MSNTEKPKNKTADAKGKEENLNTREIHFIPNKLSSGEEDISKEHLNKAAKSLVQSIRQENESKLQEAESIFLKGLLIANSEEAEDFLEGLFPSKVKKLLPGHEVTPQEREALTYSDKEKAILRTGNKKEIAKVKAARRERAKHFLLNLNVLDFITISRKWINNKHYNTFKPTPAAETATKSEDYTTISTTHYFNMVGEVVSTGNLDETAENINRRKKKEAAEIVEAGQLEGILLNERSGFFMFGLPKEQSHILEEITENGKKEFDFVVGQIYKRVYDTEHNQIKPGTITITDNDLVKYKVCGTDNKKVAHRNFDKFIELLDSCKGVSVTYKINKKGEPEKNIEKKDTAHMFKLVRAKRGIYELTPNEHFNWGSALEYYTILPYSAFMLSKRSYHVFRTILQKARMDAAKKQNPAEVNISLKEIADLLRLPLDTNETRKLIKTPIRNIIDEINEIVPEISLTLDADDNANKTDYLTGSIKAAFSGNLLQTYKTIKEQKGKNIKKQIAKSKRAATAAEKRKEAKKE